MHDVKDPILVFQGKTECNNLLSAELTHRVVMVNVTFTFWLLNENALSFLSANTFIGYCVLIVQSTKFLHENPDNAVNLQQIEPQVKIIIQDMCCIVPIFLLYRSLRSPPNHR